jgi:hypothetical protein
VVFSYSLSRSSIFFAIVERMLSGVNSGYAACSSQRDGKDISAVASNVGALSDNPFFAMASLCGHGIQHPDQSQRPKPDTVSKNVSRGVVKELGRVVAV